MFWKLNIFLNNLTLHSLNYLHQQDSHLFLSCMNTVVCCITLRITGLTKADGIKNSEPFQYFLFFKENFWMLFKIPDGFPYLQDILEQWIPWSGLFNHFIFIWSLKEKRRKKKFSSSISSAFKLSIVHYMYRLYQYFH